MEVFVSVKYSTLHGGTCEWITNSYRTVYINVVISMKSQIFWFHYRHYWKGKFVIAFEWILSPSFMVRVNVVLDLVKVMVKIRHNLWHANPKMMHCGKDKGAKLMHCGEEKGNICALVLLTMHHFREISNVVCGLIWDQMHLEASKMYLIGLQWRKSQDDKQFAPFS